MSARCKMAFTRRRRRSGGIGGGGGVVTTYRADTFNRANEDPLNVPSDGGSAWIRLGASSTNRFAVASDQAVASTSGNGGGMVLQSSHADGTVKATVKVVDGAGLVFRSDGVTSDGASVGNWWRLLYSGGTLFLQRQFHESNIGTNISWSTTVNIGDVLSVVLSGSTITPQINGVTFAPLVLTGGDAVNGQTNTYHGLASFNTGATLDDFSVTA